MTLSVKSDLKAEILKVMESHVGRNNPIKANELASMFGLSTKNTFPVRQIISDLIKDGFPILSSVSNPEGYFIAQSYAEVNEYCESLRHRGIEVIIRRRDVKRALQHYFEGTVKLL